MSKKNLNSPGKLCKEALVPEEEHPYKVPGNWVWVRLGATAQFLNGIAFKPSQWAEEGIPIIRIQNLNKENPNYKKFNYYQGLYDEKYIIKNGDLLFAWSGNIGTSFGSRIYEGETGILNQHIFKVSLTSIVEKMFFHFGINSRLGDIHNKAHGGAGLSHITKKELEALPFPLPPFDEQKRIADKVERLLDKTNQAKQLIEEAKETFELRRAAILDKAFRGELTKKWREENANTQSAHAFVDKIRSHKVKDKAALQLDDREYDSILFKLPETWIWTKLMEYEGDEQLVLTGPFGTTLSNKDFVNQGTPVLTIGCLQEDGINLEKANYVTKEKADTLERYKLKKNDILFSRMATVGRASKVEEEFEDCLINYHIMRLRLPSYINVDYFLLVVKGSPSTKLFLESVNHGMTRDGINTKELLNLPIPFPPVEEQMQIVKYYNNFLEKEREITKHLESLTRDLSVMINSILTKAFRGELGTNDPSEAKSYPV